jgi:hypothetical protein
VTVQEALTYLLACIRGSQKPTFLKLLRAFYALAASFTDLVEDQPDGFGSPAIVTADQAEASVYEIEDVLVLKGGEPPENPAIVIPILMQLFFYLLGKVIK